MQFVSARDGGDARDVPLSDSAAGHDDDSIARSTDQFRNEFKAFEHARLLT